MWIKSFLGELYCTFVKYKPHLRNKNRQNGFSDEIQQSISLIIIITMISFWRKELLKGGKYRHKIDYNFAKYIAYLRSGKKITSIAKLNICPIQWRKKMLS